jgi:ABC-2 type transport system permease protein
MRRIFLQEWRLFVSSRANLWLLGLLLTLSLLAAWNGIERVAAERETAQRAVAADRLSYAEKRTRLVGLTEGRLSQAQFGSAGKAHQAVLGEASARPLVPYPAEMQALSSAISRPTPALLRVGMQTRHRDQQPSLEDPSNRLDGAFDLAFVASWLVPLFCLVLGFDVLARDREEGITGLLASQGSSLRRIILARLSVRFIAITSIVGGTALLAALLAAGPEPVATIPAFLFWFLALCLMVGFWLAVVASVNATARSAATASIALLTIWIFISILAPAVIGAAVNAFAPPPNRMEGVLRLRATDADLNRRRRDVTAQYYARNPQNRPIAQGDEYENYFVTELYPRTLAFDQTFAPHARAMDQARIRQVQGLRLASILTPSLAFRLLTDDLAGGAPERRVSFLRQVDAFQAAWRGHFGAKLASMRPLAVSDYDRMPQFRALPEFPAERWPRLLLLLAALLIPFLLAAAIAWRKLRLANP